jgi:hypothetical protein
MSTAPRRRITVVVAAVSALSILPAAAPEPLPYHVTVSVEWGRALGPVSIRESLENRVIAELAAHRCFRSVASDIPESPKDDDLRLRLIVHDYNDEIDFEFGVADHDGPDLERRQSSVARVQARFQARLTTLAGDHLLRERSFRQNSSWRPLELDDPSEQARRQMVENAARATRKFACKGSSSSWSRQLERARSAPER